jgi:hypothetical protein
MTAVATSPGRIRNICRIDHWQYACRGFGDDCRVCCQTIGLSVLLVSSHEVVLSFAWRLPSVIKTHINRLVRFCRHLAQTKHTTTFRVMKNVTFMTLTPIAVLRMTTDRITNIFLSLAIEFLFLFQVSVVLLVTLKDVR